MRINVKRERVKTLCSTCRYGAVAENFTGNIMVNCEFFNRVEEKIVECEEFFSKSVPTFGELLPIAYVLDMKEKKQWGFLTPDEYSKKYDEVDDNKLKGHGRRRIRRF